MVNSYTLLASLQRFLHERGIDVDKLSIRDAALAMIDWQRLVPVDDLQKPVKSDVLLYRYGGWSEGCATGYKVSVMRRVTQAADGGGQTDWYAGITFMFEPSRFSSLPDFGTEASDWPSTDAFLHAIESSAAYRLAATERPMGVSVETGGLR
ncbi:MAG: hypothetical protein GC151_01515 [Betaproteobacteria bacterium]|nr:hypothetical protein [Betaproteobacteria bacterium]